MIPRLAVGVIYIALVFFCLRTIYRIVMKMRLELNKSEGIPMRFGNRDDKRDLGLLWRHHQVFPNSKLTLALIGMLVPLLAVMVCGMLLMMKFSN